jgi:hypothetical protein
LRHCSHCLPHRAPATFIVAPPLPSLFRCRRATPFIVALLVLPSSSSLHQHTAAAFIIAPLRPLPSSSRRRCLHCSAAGAPLPSSSHCWFYLRRQAFINTLLLPSSSRHCSHCLPHRAAAAFIVAPPLPSLFRCQRATTPFIVALMVLPSSSCPHYLPFVPPLPSSLRHRCLNPRAAAAFIVAPLVLPSLSRHCSLHHRAAGCTSIVAPPLPSFHTTAYVILATAQGRWWCQ